MGDSIYGPLGIVIGEVFFAFPHALLIILTALATADQRLYEAAIALRARPWRIFRTVTLPGCRYGLVSAGFVVFTLVITDFGVPKVIGGSYNVLATDVYKQVDRPVQFPDGRGRRPAAADAGGHLVFRRPHDAAPAGGAACRHAPSPTNRSPARGFDVAGAVYCGIVAFMLLGILAVAAFGSVIAYWPYDLSLDLEELRFQQHRHQWLGRLLEQPERCRLRRRFSERRSSSPAPTWWRRRRGSRSAAR